MKKKRWRVHQFGHFRQVYRNYKTVENSHYLVKSPPIPVGFRSCVRAFPLYVVNLTLRSGFTLLSWLISLSLSLPSRSLYLCLCLCVCVCVCPTYLSVCLLWILRLVSYHSMLSPCAYHATSLPGYTSFSYSSSLVLWLWWSVCFPVMIQID